MKFFLVEIMPIDFSLSINSSIASRHTYNTQSDNVVKINCIFVDETHIVTVGDDCLVKILDFTPKKENRE